MIRSSLPLLSLAVLCTAAPLLAQPDLSSMSGRQRIQAAEKEQLEASADGEFQSLMDRGHELFREKQYLKAVRMYERAKEKRPLNVYPKVKITDIQLSMQDTLDFLAAEEKRTDDADRRGDRVRSDRPDRPEESKEERLKKIDDWERKEREKLEQDRKRQSSPDTPPVSGSGGDVKKVSLEEYRKELAEKYPSGITEEVSTEGNKTIVKRIVVREGRGNEYKRVEHGWGGVFYFKNGDAVTERVWKSETE